MSTPAERQRWRDYQRNLNRFSLQSRQYHVHRCSLCNEQGHNARTCKACSGCGKPGEFATNQGRLCQACLEVAA